MKPLKTNSILFFHLVKWTDMFNWWLRNGTRDNHTSQTVLINLVTSLENYNKEKVAAKLPKTIR